MDSYKLSQIRDKQRDIDLDLERIRRLRSAGDAKPSELEWLAEQETIQASLEAIVESGIKHRAEKAATEENA